MCNSSNSSTLPARIPLDMGTDVGVGVTINRRNAFLDGVPLAMGTDIGVSITVAAAVYFLLKFCWIWGLMLG